MDYPASETQHIVSSESSWDVAAWALIAASGFAIVLVLLVITLIVVKVRKK